MSTSFSRALFRFTAALSFSILLVAYAFAQNTTGDIKGRVTDQLGNIVPGAMVTARNQGTGLERAVTTDETGEFTMAQLPAGRYDLSVEARSFSKSLLKDVELNVGATQSIKIELKPGEITETVEVTSDAALVETTTSELGRNITPIEVQNLPLINRTFANLSIVAPEARPVGNFDPTKTRVGNIAFSGGDGRQVDVNVDGGDNKDNVVGSLLQNFAYESIQEFQVLQHRWTAESGRSVGGVVNVITKSGSNEFHGSGFYNFRNQSLRARDFFEKQDNSEKPDYSRQEYGGSIGGRIIRDRLFFFGAIEHFRERQNLLLQTNQLAQLTAIPGITPVGIIPTPYNDTLLSVKVDNRISNRQSMFYRYSYQKNDSPNDQFDITLPSDLSGGNTNNNTLHSFVINHSYSFSPTTLNQFSFQFQDFKNAILAVSTDPNLQFPSVQSGANQNVPQQTTERKWQFRDDFSILAGNHSLKFGGNYIRTSLGGFFLFGANGYVITFFDDPLTIRNNLPSSHCPASTATTLVSCYPLGFATPGAINRLEFNGGQGDTTQPPFHQIALYVQDDYRITPRLTLNLGLRWDANLGILTDQTDNRTMRILARLNDPRAQAITRDDLSRRTPSLLEFQPRIGFAWDVSGTGRTVIRGGYGIFYDQIFQNLTLFSLQQTHAIIYQTLLQQQNTAVGVGTPFLSTFRYGVDPLPAPAATGLPDLENGAFGRINDPRMEDPYVQKFSLGVETKIGDNYVLSSDYVHTLGLHEARVQNINPLIRSVCDPTFPGVPATPSTTLCPRGADTRYFDRAFVAAGIIPGRLEQINMFTSNNRSMFDSWTTTLRRRTRRTLLSASYVLSSARSWGGLPTASYSGNSIAVTPEQQFRPEEFGPSRIDERHRIVVSGVFDLPYNFQLAPIIQFASSRPFSAIAGTDLDGDGRSTIDRICSGVDARAVLDASLAGTALPAGTIAPGCVQARVNQLRSGFVNSGGTLEERSGRYFNVDLRVQKTVPIGDKLRIRGYLNFFNLFNTENLSFGNRFGFTTLGSGTFMRPASLYGPGFGPPVGIPFTLQLGVRADF